MTGTDPELPLVYQLPPELLHDVLAQLPDTERRCVLPRVSKHFAAAVRDPTLWEMVRIVHEDHDGRGLSNRRLRAWILARARCIKHVELRLGSRANDSMAGGVAALLQPLAVSARLHCLTLHVPGKLQPRDIMAIVSLTNLVELDLEVGVRAGVMCSALSSLRHLTRLQDLRAFIKLGGSAVFCKFPEGLLELTALWRLALRTTPNVDFGCLPPGVTALRRLENMELRDCFVLPDAEVDRDCLPSGFGTLPLTRLVLAPYAFNSDGRGSSPLAELRGLSGLRELVLERCQVNDRACELPAAESLSCLTALTSISLRESPSIAQDLPPSMDWCRMVSADLSQCRLRCVSECMLQANNLREVDLTLNDLEEFPNVDWPEVQALKLSHNRLLSLLACSMPSLRRLDISYNRSPLFQLNPTDVTMLSERWPQLSVLDLDRGKTVDIGRHLPPPRWTYDSLFCAFEALGRAQPDRDVKLILHRGPLSAHQCVLTVADVRDVAGQLLSAHEAFARRFAH